MSELNNRSLEELRQAKNQALSKGGKLVSENDIAEAKYREGRGPKPPNFDQYKKSNLNQSERNPEEHYSQVEPRKTITELKETELGQTAEKIWEKIKNGVNGVNGVPSKHLRTVLAAVVGKEYDQRFELKVSDVLTLLTNFENASDEEKFMAKLVMEEKALLDAVKKFNSDNKVREYEFAIIEFNRIMAETA
ncbi:MAG: hypothetical protein R3B41_00645 [Candidatus Doudnabacteria bacterium]